MSRDPDSIETHERSDAPSYDGRTDPASRGGGPRQMLNLADVVQSRALPVERGCRARSRTCPTPSARRMAAGTIRR